MQLSSSSVSTSCIDWCSSAYLRERDSEPLGCRSFEKSDVQQGKAPFEACLLTWAQFFALPGPPGDEGLDSLQMLDLSTSNVAEIPVWDQQSCGVAGETRALLPIHARKLVVLVDIQFKA